MIRHGKIHRRTPTVDTTEPIRNSWSFREWGVDHQIHSSQQADNTLGRTLIFTNKVYGSYSHSNTLNKRVHSNHSNSYASEQKERLSADTLSSSEGVKARNVIPGYVD